MKNYFIKFIARYMKPKNKNKKKCTECEKLQATIQKMKEDSQNKRDQYVQTDAFKQTPQKQQAIHIQLCMQGMQNLGNTCWMNAGLQCLLHTIPLVGHFKNNQWQNNLNTTNKFGTGGVMTREFASIVNDTSNKAQGAYNPRSFRQKLIQFAPQFTLGNQHDSQQFINFLLDALHEDLNQIKEKPYIKGIPSNGRPDKIVSQECWDKHSRRNKSFIVDLMHGQLKQTLKCDQCKQTQVTFDPFQMFCVEIPKQETGRKNQQQRYQMNLHDCIRFLQREEHLEGMNQFYCEKCKNHVNGTKNINLYKAPQIFIVYLKRFIQNGYDVQKNDTSINYPLELNLQEFLPEQYQESTVYDLYAVDIHSGTVGGGHYYAYAKVDGEWYEFNDSRVGKCSNAQTSNAYVLFYQKRN